MNKDEHSPANVRVNIHRKFSLCCNDFLHQYGLGYNWVCYGKDEDDDNN